MPDIDLLVDVWTELDKSDLYKQLTIKICSKEIKPKEQFAAYYSDAAMLFTVKEQAENMFYMILAGNEWLVKQIVNRSKWLAELENLDHWANVEDFNSTNSTKNKMIDKTEVTNALTGTGKVTIKNTDETGTKTKTGATDASVYDDENYEKYLDVENIQDIPANSMTQAGTVAVGNAESNTNDLTTSEGKTVSAVDSETQNTAITFYKRRSSNSSTDYREILNLEVSDLTARFWGKFAVMFYFHG